ncbi:tonB-system energizer ExbB [Novispirillum sp. DQ9]|uniref:tonB-system energizer ExbB n=1 Tax=Novispirillum sp. DQ9 TaxID=3398612 RepID=UPI003C7CB3BE
MIRFSRIGLAVAAALLLVAPRPLLAQAEGPAGAPVAAPLTAPLAALGSAPPADVPADIPAATTPAPTSAPVAEDGPAALPHDLSAWGMFMAADWVVKAVMIGLALASVATWTVWLAKTVELRGERRRLSRALEGLGQVRSLLEAKERVSGPGAPAALVQAALAEIALSPDLPADGIKERVASRLERIEAAAGRRMTKGTGILASIGSTGPFIGLFGTVWGIMNSFIGISQAQTTNLAVVAPGIAEALLATALGLVAAIPAVMIYNAFARAISGVRAQLGDASAEVMRLVSRDLDRGRRPALRAAE